MKNVVFDLDQTLVNSRVLSQYRKQRDWQRVYRMIPKTSLYAGIQEVFGFIQENAIPVCIVSTAPRPYIERMVAYHHIPCDAIVGYHDAKPIKPHPAPMYKALSLLGIDKGDAISFGDRVIDIESSNRAGITSIACLWDSDEPIAGTIADNTITSPLQIIPLLS